MLLAAKVAAEVAERVGVPAVVGEILAGVLIGPSALGLVGGDEVLRVLGELGVLLLLLQVGLEMDLAELGAVGRASMSVAIIGVVLPMAAGFGAGLALDMSGEEALFVGAALTATSVGITARVFGDLRALATVEARTVLGAAVADDVLGLVILTVVVRVVEVGSVSAGTVASVIAVAAGFLVVACVAGVRLAPGLFALVQRYSRSPGTLVALAFAFTLAIAELADAAKLAPIVGAFVAGLALTRSPASERIRRELAPVGHLFIPVFFLQIGIDAEIDRFADPSVLRLAGVLLVVGVLGKLAASGGLFGAPGDRLLIGLGMIPRGEVGLIFAAIGMRQGVFGEDVYAALLLMVLVTTLMTPPLLRWRLQHIRRASAAGSAAAPPGGWLRLDQGVFDLVSEPLPGDALRVALTAAAQLEGARPGARLLDWLSRLPEEPLRWDPTSRQRFFTVLAKGGPRAWRFLTLTGVLHRALPELAAGLEQRQRDASDLDPLGASRWPVLARLSDLRGWSDLQHPEWLLLAAVILDATAADGRNGDGPPPVAVARRITQRLGLGAGAEQAVAGMVADVGLLPAAARRIDGMGQEHILQLAAHIGSVEQAQALALLARAATEPDPVTEERLREIEALLVVALSHPELTSRAASNTVEQRRSEAARLTSDSRVLDRIAHTPRAYVLQVPASDLVRQAALCEPPPGGKRVRVTVQEASSPQEWRLEVVARDRSGLLARETGVFARQGYDVATAAVATWGDGCALGSFTLRDTRAPDPDVIAGAIAEALDEPIGAPGVPEASVEFDDEASPWHTVCTVSAPDRPGLLHALTTAFASAGASVHAARIATVDGAALDVFEVTDAAGRKLDPGRQARIVDALRVGTVGARRRRKIPLRRSPSS